MSHEDHRIGDRRHLRGSRIHRFQAAVNFIFGAFLGALFGTSIWLFFAGDSPIWAFIIGGGAAIAGTLAALHGESFWNYFKNTIWWRIFFGG